MIEPNEIFDRQSSWNAVREELEKELLARAEKLIDHCDAAKLSLKGRDFEVVVERISYKGPHQ